MLSLLGACQSNSVVAENAVWCGSHKFIVVKDATALVKASRDGADRIYNDNARGMKSCGWKPPAG